MLTDFCIDYIYVGRYYESSAEILHIFHFQLQSKWTGYFESAIWNKVEDPPYRTDCLFIFVKVDDKQLESTNDNQLDYNFFPFAENISKFRFRCR